MTTNKEYRSFDVKPQFEDGYFQGYASKFYDGNDGTEFQLGRNRFERIHPSAYKRALEESHDAIFCYNHMTSEWMISRVSSGNLRLHTDKIGLFYRSKYNPNNPIHQTVYEWMKDNELRGSSFQFEIIGDQWKRDAGKEIRYITDLRLIDVSVVQNPAYTATTASVRSADETYARWKQKEEWEIRKKNFDLYSI